MISKPIFLTFMTGAILGLGGGEAIRHIPRHEAMVPAPPPVAVITMPYHTVSWFMANQEEMKRQIAECKDDPGHWVDTPYCINADIALTRVYAEQSEAEFHKAFPK